MHTIIASLSCTIHSTDILHDDTSTKDQQQTAIEQMKNILDKLAKYNIIHGDLKHTNILIGINGPILIDLESIKKHLFNWTCRKRMAKDLNNFMNKGADQYVEL